MSISEKLAMLKALVNGKAKPVVSVVSVDAPLSPLDRIKARLEGIKKLVAARESALSMQEQAMRRPNHENWIGHQCSVCIGASDKRYEGKELKGWDEKDNEVRVPLHFCEKCGPLHHHTF